MKIKELRIKTKMSQSKFAKHFQIPLSTLQAWEQERRIPAPYIVCMIKMILEEQGYI